ncbi:MAG TPA: sigma 54-interacting transcriptional regulator [Thermoanaerobaculia bacterium]|nr:sigma 54-interacting transcriptional regulator [Thermoanaerobaculia bacterium]
MAPQAVWLAGLEGGQGGLQRKLAAELAGRGLDCHPLASPREPAPGPALLFFDACGPELLERVSALSRGGQERLLALGTHREALARGDGWRLLAAGASDVLLGPEIPDPAELIASRLARWREVDALVDSPLVTRHLAGRGLAWRSLLRQVVEVARYSASPVLLLGESGTGKELIARLIHSLDAREDRRELVVLDCTTIVPGLAGSEFFGHERGAFTGAVTARDGAMAMANGGTLFLDEIGELPAQLQAELLRVVQEGTYKRVGSNVWQSTRFRLVSATHRDLHEEIRDGRFRHDFYYRIAASTCRLPPLRERREDIPLLVEHFLAERSGGPRSNVAALSEPSAPPAVSAPVMDLLLGRDYPGNVRELRQLVHRIAHRHVGNGPITIGDVPEEERPQGECTGLAGGDGFEPVVRLALARGLGLKQIGALAADAAVRLALEGENGNLRRAAEKLGVTDRALQMRRATGRAAAL